MAAKKSATTKPKGRTHKVSNDTEIEVIAPNVIEWSEPPVIIRGQRRSKYQGIIDALEANPDTWAKVMEHANPASAKVFTNHGCEITTRSDGNGRVDVWAMFPSDGGIADEDEDEGEAEDDDDDTETEVTSRRRKRPVKRTPAKV